MNGVGTTPTRVQVCGIRRPDLPQYSKWPRVCCLLDDGHPGDHVLSRQGVAVYWWPRLAGEIRGLLMWRRGE